MTKREYALAAMRVAGYHDDHKSRARLIVEHRISRANFDEAWRKGIEQRQGGMRCHCYDCKQQ